ncbi:MAG: SpoIIIAH-like family protein [Clostridiales bacterium]|nr:SpoIIIAH-like family protein [Clostridiales bacterium]
MNFNEQLKRLEQQENEKGLFKKSHRAQEPEQTQPQQAAENAQAQPEEAQLQQAAFTAGPQQETVKNVNEPLVQQEPLQFAQDSDVESTGEESKKIKKGNRRFKAAVALTIVVLAVGVAANWYWENSDISDSIQPVLSAVEEKTKTIGEATYVDATTEATTQNEYFSTARVERQQARDEALENLQSVADGATGSVKENAEANIEKISSYITIENKIETLVKAKGINNCLAVVSDDGQGVQIIVDSQDLDDQTILQIKEIAIDQLGCSYENVTIIQSKQ